MVELTRSEAESLFEILETHLIEIVRDDEEIDNLNWLYNILVIWKKCRDAATHHDHHEKI